MAQHQKPLSRKVKLMCSYGGKILPKPNNNKNLSYIGGETKILSVDRKIKFSALITMLYSLCKNDDVVLKYQLPGEDLDTLISVINDEDLENMMIEYDLLCRSSIKPVRLRLILFPLSHSDSSPAAELSDSTAVSNNAAKSPPLKSENRYFRELESLLVDNKKNEHAVKGQSKIQNKENRVQNIPPLPPQPLPVSVPQSHVTRDGYMLGAQAQLQAQSASVLLTVSVPESHVMSNNYPLRVHESVRVYIRAPSLETRMHQALPAMITPTFYYTVPRMVLQPQHHQN